MAVAFTKPTDLARNAGNAGPLRIRVFDAAFSSSYAAGGEAIAPTDVGMSKGIVAVLGTVTEAAGMTAGLPVVWNNATGKLQLYESAASGSPAGEKGAEAYAATTAGRLTFIGY